MRNTAGRRWAEVLASRYVIVEQPKPSRDVTVESMVYSVDGTRYEIRRVQHA